MAFINSVVSKWYVDLESKALHPYHIAVPPDTCLVLTAPTQFSRKVSKMSNLELGSSLEGIEIHSHETAPETCWEKFRRKFGHVWKSVLVCFLMLIAGIILVSLPTLFPSLKQSGAIGLYVAGSLLLIPSVYMVYIMYNVFRDRYGYNMDEFEDNLI